MLVRFISFIYSVYFLYNFDGKVIENWLFPPVVGEETD